MKSETDLGLKSETDLRLKSQATNGRPAGLKTQTPTAMTRLTKTALRTPLWWLLTAAAVLAADPPPPGPDAEKPASDAEAARAEVRAADLAYQLAAKRRDREAFHALLSADAMFFAGELHRGRIDYVAAWEPLFEGKHNFRYRGEPRVVTVARSGEIAWSLGDAETSFTRPGTEESSVISSQYMTVWARDSEGRFKVAASASLVVHPELGLARDPRSGLMTAWPELADQIDAAIEIEWLPEKTVRAASGELAYSFGEYRVEFRRAGGTLAGSGAFLAVWEKDDGGRWQLAAEGFTPPGIYGDSQN